MLLNNNLLQMMTMLMEAFILFPQTQKLRLKFVYFQDPVLFK